MPSLAALALQVPLPAILPCNTALEGLLACQSAECGLCGEEMERASLDFHRLHDCKQRQVSCKGTCPGSFCSMKGLASDLHEGRCKSCHLDVLQQHVQDKKAEINTRKNLIAEVQENLRELAAEQLKVGWSRPCLVPLQPVCHRHAALLQAEGTLLLIQEKYSASITEDSEED